MAPVKQYLNRRLTAREAIFVIFLLAGLAGFVYWVYQLAAARLLEAKVKAAVPSVCAAIREERGKVLSAIEEYKAHFGSYPPDHVLSRRPLIVDPVTNTLLYELVGVVYNPLNKKFQVAGLEPAEADYVKRFFQCDGFRNCAETPERITRFLKTDALPARQLHDDPDTFALGFWIPYERLEPDIVWEFETSPWRYVSSAPTNNPGRFDLWIELKTKSRTVVIGNWKAGE